MLNSPRNKATLHILNLRNPDYIKELQIISKLVQLFKRKLKEDNTKVAITYYFRDTKFADKVLQTAHNTDESIDLLVISSEKENAEHSFHLSNYAQQIINQANIPVLISKPEKITNEKGIVLQELERKMNCN
ncbi:MAG: universal stress protein [Parafilimonas sp.]